MIKVLVVDDSAPGAEAASGECSAPSRTSMLQFARNGVEALQQLEDFHRPTQSSRSTYRCRRWAASSASTESCSRSPCPVVMVSSRTPNAGEVKHYRRWAAVKELGLVKPRLAVAMGCDGGAGALRHAAIGAPKSRATDLWMGASAISPIHPSLRAAHAGRRPGASCFVTSRVRPKRIRELAEWQEDRRLSSLSNVSNAARSRVNIVVAGYITNRTGYCRAIARFRIANLLRQLNEGTGTRTRRPTL